jgi:hypothetical protein
MISVKRSSMRSCVRPPPSAVTESANAIDQRRRVFLHGGRIRATKARRIGAVNVTPGGEFERELVEVPSRTRTHGQAAAHSAHRRNRGGALPALLEREPSPA